MYFKSQRSEKGVSDDSVMIINSANLESQNNSIFTAFWNYAACFVLISGTLGLFVSCPFTFLPRILSVPIHFGTVALVSASLNFVVNFGFADMVNFLLFSCKFKSDDALIKNNEQVS